MKFILSKKSIVKFRPHQMTGTSQRHSPRESEPDSNKQFSLFFFGWFDVYCLHKFSRYIPYKLFIEKQWSIVTDWGLDLQNDI